METVFRQIAPHRLTKPQFQAKLQKDSEYEIAVQNLTVSWKKDEITQEAYREQKSVLWHIYKDWAISQGLYEEVTPEQQLAEAETGLAGQIEEANLIRTELKKPLLEVKEKLVIKEL